MLDADLLALAEQIATDAHAGMLDKAGVDYIYHPRAVTDCVRLRGGSIAQQVAAWLHDVVEDSLWTLHDLRDAGIPDEAVAIVDAVTKRRGEDYLDAVRRAATHPNARLVKRCDVENNRDADRLALLDPVEAARLARKYRAAVAVLDDLD